jgi:polysaccharide export outer membrane protein
MKNCLFYLLLITIVSACTSTKNLNYLQNLPETTEAQYFPYDIPDYKVQYRDILYIDIKGLSPEGTIEDILQGRSNTNSNAYLQSESTQYLLGYNVDKDGNISLPAIGKMHVSKRTLTEIRDLVQHKVDSVFNHAYVECKLLSFKFTVLGEARNPGTFVNYNNYLTVLEAIGRAGGVNDFGNRNRILVVRPVEDGTKTFRIDLKDKNLLSSQAYFLMPNDVVIIEPVKYKIFNLNLPTYAFTITSVTSVISTVLLLINFLK